MKRAAALVAVVLLVLLVWWLLREEAGTVERSPVPVVGRVNVAETVPVDADEPRPLADEDAAGLAQRPASGLPAPGVRAARQARDGVLGLEEDGRHVSGRVVDSDKRPVGGASVLMVEDNWGHHGDYFEMDEDSALTDADGRFRLSLDSYTEVASLRLVVRAKGWPPWFGRVEPLADGGDIVLGRVDWLPMRLVFDDGDPVSDAIVQYENPGRDRQATRETPMQSATTIGRTGADGRLALPVFDSRSQLSVLVEHELRFGRHEAPLDAWRAGGRDFEWTLTVPRGAACELQLLGWPGEWAGKVPWLGLRLTPYVRGFDGTLALAQHNYGDPSTHALRAGFVDGRARLTRLDAPAYRVELTGTLPAADVLADRWVPVPGLTTWTRPTPPVPPECYEPLIVDLQLTGDDPAAAWSHIEWTLTATDARGHAHERRIAGPGPVEYSWNRLEAPVTLRLSDLGEAGVRTDVPAGGTYRFDLDVAAVLAATGGVRVDSSALPSAPPADESQLVIWPVKNQNGRIIEGLEGHGLPLGRYRLRIEADGFDEQVQDVLIEAGRTTIVHALPAPPPTQGLLRGRVHVRGQDSWMRVTHVRLTNEDGADEEVDTEELGRLSFARRLEAGHYTGRVTLGRLTAPESIASAAADPEMISISRFDDLPGAGTFECDVRAGQTTDVVVEMDASGVCVLRITAPTEAEARRAGRAGPETWYIEVLRGESDHEQAGGWVGLWSDEGVTLLAPPGDWHVVAKRWPNTPPEFARLLEARITVPDGATTLDVVLQPPPPDAAPP